MCGNFRIGMVKKWDLDRLIHRVIIWHHFWCWSYFNPPGGPGAQAYFSGIFNNVSLFHGYKWFHLLSNRPRRLFKCPGLLMRPKTCHQLTPRGRVFHIWKDVLDYNYQLGYYVVHNFKLDAKKIEFGKGNPFPAIFLKIVKGKHGFYNVGKIENFEILFLARKIYQYWSRIY